MVVSGHLCYRNEWRKLKRIQDVQVLAVLGIGMDHPKYLTGS